MTLFFLICDFKKTRTVDIFSSKQNQNKNSTVRKKKVVTMKKNQRYKTKIISNIVEYFILVYFWHQTFS